MARWEVEVIKSIKPDSEIEDEEITT